MAFVGGTEENHEKPQDGRYTRRDLNPRPPEYKAEVLVAQPRRLVSSIWKRGGAICIDICM
jgi:hypothetical protein